MTPPLRRQVNLDAVVPECDCLRTASQRVSLHKPGCPRLKALHEKYGLA